MTSQEKILDISKQLNLSHIGSNLSCLPILEEIYKKKKPEDIVILDNAHAHLAHLVIKDWYDSKQGMIIAPYEGMITTEDLITKYGIHCDKRAGCDASGGSLGHAIGIGIGYAIADRERDVYVIVSDGSMMEGSNWEALRIAKDLEVKNLYIHCNFNGYTAVDKTDTYPQLYNRMANYAGPNIHIIPHLTQNGEGFDGVQGHYKTI